MIRPLVARLAPAAPAVLLLLSILTPARPTYSQPPDATPGRFFTVTEPITNESLDQIGVATKQLVDRAAGRKDGQRPILVFEFRPGETSPGGSQFGSSYDLADFISTKLEGLMTVAYVPESLKGYAVLDVLPWRRP